MERRIGSRDDLIQAQQQEIDQLRRELRDERGHRQQGNEVRESEREIARLRRMISSKGETIESLKDALREGEEAREGDEEDYKELCDACFDLASAIESRTVPATPPPSQAPSCTPLRSQIDLETSQREAVEQQLSDLSLETQRCKAKYYEERKKLLDAIENASQAQPQGTADLSVYDNNVESEKHVMLLTLQETKDDLLEEFSLMRSRLRARIAILEKNSESKQRRVEECHASNDELERNVLGVKDRQQRVSDQYRSRLESSQQTLSRAKAREAKAHSQLTSSAAECEDLKISLHSTLAGAGHRQSTAALHSKTPQSVRTPGRPVYR